MFKQQDCRDSWHNSQGSLKSHGGAIPSLARPSPSLRVRSQLDRLAAIINTSTRPQESLKNSGRLISIAILLVLGMCPTTTVHAYLPSISSSVSVAAAYADTEGRPGAGNCTDCFPSPWCGSPGVQFIGSSTNYNGNSTDPGNCKSGGWDAGAILVTNNGSTSITLTNLTVMLPLPASGDSRLAQLRTATATSDIQPLVRAAILLRQHVRASLLWTAQSPYPLAGKQSSRGPAATAHTHARRATTRRARRRPPTTLTPATPTSWADARRPRTRHPTPRSHSGRRVRAHYIHRQEPRDRHRRHRPWKLPPHRGGPPMGPRVAGLERA